jgi:multimeric flavodoxin WrbA
MVENFITHLSRYDKKKVLFLTTSTRWDGDKELPKSTQLAYHLADRLKEWGVSVTVMDVANIKIYQCEGNVSTMRGNTCGLKESILNDKTKNPSGQHRCWASLNKPDDELWKISKELLDSSAVVFFASVRWGQANAVYQRLIERLNWLENRHTTLGESNIIENVEAGFVAVGQNWRTAEVLEVQRQVLTFYGFKVPPALSFNWQFTADVNDETEISYIEAPSAFEKFFKFKLKGKMEKLKEGFLEFKHLLENFNQQFPHQIKSESYWRKVLSHDNYALKVLDTVMKKQKGYASDRQMALMKKVASGDNSSYPTKH